MHGRPRTISGVVVLILAASLFGPIGTASAAAPVLLSGRVTYTATGGGIPWENVTLYRKVEQSGDLVLDTAGLTLTDANGYYSIDISALPDGYYTLRFGLPYLHPTVAEYWDDRSTLQAPDLFYLDTSSPLSNRNANLELGPTFPTTRIAGADRFATSAAIAAEYPPLPPDGAVFIASGLDFPDALSAAPLAGSLGAPLLLTRPDSLPASVLAQLIRLAPTYIVVIGGTGVVSNSVYDELVTLVGPDNIQRIAGSDRYETSRTLVETYDWSVHELFIATGTGFADALAVAPVAGQAGSPVLLVNGSASTLDDETRAAIQGLAPDLVTIVGGTGVVSTGIETELSALLSPAQVNRVGGPDRYQTAVLVNERAYTSAATVLLATGTGFADALAGAAYGGTNGYPLFLTPGTCLNSHVWGSGFFVLEVSSAVLLGGTGSLGPAVANLQDCITQASFQSTRPELNSG